MEIVVGKINELGSAGHGGAPMARGDVPVRVLKVRPARSGRRGQPEGENRRDSNEGSDPMRGKVLVLMVPDGSRLPHDLETGSYTLRLKILAENKEGSPDKGGKSLSESGFTLKV
ncbi:hypothetical protein OOT00_12545 [Desulfobotulus sp. H1]|uniref:Uncharacterized protein n=1 Tax=Desulfobotulus pelophilus TaxID=2823377 RepID=A0ABT3NBH5_9BACT|nr:hypothetical protein [Desulfobotulus pelophilus]MCW7754812.1 hypothetical protein [Desulfobotulus pelophilus]